MPEIMSCYRWILMLAAFGISCPGPSADTEFRGAGQGIYPYRQIAGSSYIDDPLVEDGDKVFHLASAVDAKEPTAQENAHQAISAQDLWHRKKLTGDWGAPVPGWSGKA